MVAAKTRRALAAAGLLFVVSHSTAAVEPYIYQPLPTTVFRVVDEPSPSYTPIVDTWRIERPDVGPDRLTPSAIPRNTPRRTAAPTVASASGTSLTGIASWYASSCNCTAMTDQRWRGEWVWISGPNGTAHVLVNDAGPVPSLHRVADLNPETFQAVCGPLSKGICRVTISR